MKAVLALIASLFVAACSSGEDRPAKDWSALAAKAPDAFPVVLDRMKVVAVYRLNPFATWNDPPPDTPMFHEWVIGRSGVPDAEYGEALTRSMRALVDEPRLGDGVPACFEPYHGVRFSDGRLTFDVVLCFKCIQYRVYSPEGKPLWGGQFVNKTREHLVWGEVFEAALSD